MSYTGRIEIRATALEAIHHGAGTEGNTVTLRRQETLRSDGTIDQVPFVSGNSIRHMLRDAGTRFALEAMGVPEASLSKAVVDLLFSGGSLTSKGSMTLAKARKIAELFPHLAVLGYSAGSRITGGRIEVWNLHLVCEQNLFRRPEVVAPDEPRWLLDGNGQVSSNFGTRHDAGRIAHAAAYLALPAQSSLLAAADAPKGKVKAPKDEASTQMIYDWEVVMPGAEFFGGIAYRGLKEAELSALGAALQHASDGQHTDGGWLFTVGAKRATGHGRMSWHFTGLEQRLVAPDMVASTALIPALAGDQHAARIDAYREHLVQRRAEILADLEEIAA